MSSPKRLKERNGVVLWETPSGTAAGPLFIKYKVTCPPPARERVFSTHTEAEEFFNEAAARYEPGPETD